MQAGLLVQRYWAVYKKIRGVGHEIPPRVIPTFDSIVPLSSRDTQIRRLQSMCLGFAPTQRPDQMRLVDNLRGE